MPIALKDITLFAAVRALILSACGRRGAPGSRRLCGPCHGARAVAPVNPAICPSAGSSCTLERTCSALTRSLDVVRANLTRAARTRLQRPHTAAFAAALAPEPSDASSVPARTSCAPVRSRVLSRRARPHACSRRVLSCVTQCALARAYLDLFASVYSLSTPADRVRYRKGCNSAPRATKMTRRATVLVCLPG